MHGANDFRHIVITSFNARNTPPFDKTTDIYLRERWEIFTMITVPSIENQINKNFIWYVFFSPDSPGWLMQKIKNQQFKCDVEIVFQYFNDFYNSAKNEGPVFLTTKLDSDDALHKNATNVIQKAFLENGTKYQVFNFEYGYQYHVNSGFLFRYNFHSPAFQTKVNLPGENPFDLGTFHPNLPKLFTYLEISKGERLILQTIHKRNLANRMYFKAKLIKKQEAVKILENDFRIVTHRKSNLLKFLSHNFWVFLKKVFYKIYR